MRVKIQSSLSAFVVAVLLGLCATALALEPEPGFIHLDSFNRAHPDLYWRRQGVIHYERGRFEAAFQRFRWAARHADKPSQAMIAQMLWNGDGIPQDRVMAYVWADLAAERGYPDFVFTRERFWQALSTRERRQALAAGVAVFDEFADEVAKPRQERALHQARSQITGSRTGHVGTVVVRQYVHETGNVERTDGSLYYQPEYWQPRQYWEWQDRAWRPDPKERVEVGPIRLPGKE